VQRKAEYVHINARQFRTAPSPLPGVAVSASLQLVMITSCSDALTPPLWWTLLARDTIML